VIARPGGMGGWHVMADIKAQVRSYLLDNFLMGGSEADVKDDASFMGTHILDSTGFIELIGYLEEQFGIEVTDEEMVPENLDSLECIERFVSRKRLPAAAGAQ